MKIDFESLKDLLFNIVERWERDGNPEVQYKLSFNFPEENFLRQVESVARLAREEIQKAELNTARSEDYLAPDLSTPTSEPETKEIFEQIL